MSNPSETPLILTREHRRFAEFCEACQRDQYIGLCFGPPGVGKTFSARRYAAWDQVEALRPLGQAVLQEVQALQGISTLFYTPGVVNSPVQIERDIQRLRQGLHHLRLEPLRREEAEAHTRVVQYETQQQQARNEWAFQGDWGQAIEEPPRTEPTFTEISGTFRQRRRQVADPTRLILVDEADRLKMTSLEQMRAIFDAGGIGLILMGMPGLEKRLARYPQLYSRVGFVHEFHSLSVEELRHVLQSDWAPALPHRAAFRQTDEETFARMVRITGGNFRLLHRLCTQIARVMEINAMTTLTRPVVEAARDALVIGVA